MAAVVALAIIGTLAWVASNQRNDARELEERQAALDEYTGQVRTVLQALAGPVGEMTTSAPSLPPAQLAAKVKQWNEGFSAAQTALSQTNPPPELQPVNALLLRSILMYVSAADTYELVPDVDGPGQKKLVTQAGIQVQNADGVFVGAIAVLDTAREEAELRISGLEAPSAAAPPAGPQPTPGAEGSSGTNIDTGEGGGGGGGAGGGGKGGAGGGKKNSEKGNG